MNMLSELQAKLISDLKANSQEIAHVKALDIRDENLNTVGKLIPIGLWIEHSSPVIESIARWRAREMRNFMVQFESSFEKSKNYLVNKASKENDRLLFLILDDSGNLIGHIGISNITVESAELDNMMRGNPGGPKNLMELAEKAVIDFLFTKLNVKSIHLRVLSFNFLAISIHQRLGFVESKREYLRKKTVGDDVHHEPTTREFADVSFTSITMTKFK